MSLAKQRENVRQLLARVGDDWSDRVSRLLLADALEEFEDARGRLEHIDLLRSERGFWALECRPNTMRYLVWYPGPRRGKRCLIVARTWVEFRCKMPMHRWGVKPLVLWMRPKTNHVPACQACFKAAKAPGRRRAEPSGVTG